MYINQPAIPEIGVTPILTPFVDVPLVSPYSEELESFQSNLDLGKPLIVAEQVFAYNENSEKVKVDKEKSK